MASPDQPEDIKRKAAERKAERKAKLGTSMTRTGNPIGRPKGGSLAVKALNDFAEGADFPAVMNALVLAAKDPDHKAFAAAQKLIWDRIGHISHFDKPGGGTGHVAVNINISTMGEVAGEVVDEQ